MTRHPSKLVRGKLANADRPQRHPRHGFTLIELLAVVSIIALLSALLMGALWRATIATKVDKTQGMVTRLGEVLTYKYEQYRTRRLPVDLRERVTNSIPIRNEIIALLGETPNPNNTRHLAIARLLCLRELMRMEMPRCREDMNDPQYLRTPPEPGFPNGKPIITAVAQYHRNHLFTSPKFEDAACLYLICQTLGPDDPVTDNLKHLDFGDADNDGALEYHDAWGHPIIWFRWAPGYDSDFQSLNGDSDHDPFDPRRLDRATGRGFRLVPLVVSAGIDGEFDLQRIQDFTTSKTFQINAQNDPYHVPKSDPTVGTRLAPGRWADNITNHLSATK